MKFVMIILVFSPLLAYSQISAQEQTATTSGCIPFRDPGTGEISRYECDQSKLRLIKAGKMEKLGIQKMKVMKMNSPQTGKLQPTDTVEKAMEKYNSLKESGRTQLEVEKQPEE